MVANQPRLVMLRLKLNLVTVGWAVSTNPVIPAGPAPAKAGGGTNPLEADLDNQRLPEGCVPWTAHINPGTGSGSPCSASSSQVDIRITGS